MYKAVQLAVELKKGWGGVSMEEVNLESPAYTEKALLIGSQLRISTTNSDGAEMYDKSSA